ncbi:anti-sigma factor antagonist [Clostridium perfringens]|uniref:Anti-sigma factor antagonist n=1 Tax=Clostridium perfringens TaxID=1502 RepID=A0AAW9K327_CLOPF|nr:anti-sigma factor antagonist [Clostridium perfringens]
MDTNKFSAVTVKEGTQVNVLLQGELDLAAASDFRALIEPIARDVSVHLTLNLEKLSYIDSTGIGILISILKVRNSANAQLHVENVPAHIQRLLDMTGKTKFFRS